MNHDAANQSRAWHRHGNTTGDPQTAPRCGAKNRRGLPCRAPAMRGKRRCRLHGGKSTGPRTLEGVARVRAANTKTGRWSAVGKARARAERQWFWQGYRSLRALERLGLRWAPAANPGTTHPLAELARQERDGLDAAIATQLRVEAEQATADADYRRLREKGLVVAEPHRDARLAAARPCQSEGRRSSKGARRP
jgi:hypothetical protein